MMLTTQGLVLHTTKYGETSLIAKIFTRELGLCSYIVKGVRTTKGRTKQNLLHPLSHLELTVYNNSKRDLQYIKEMRSATHYNNINNDGKKMAMLFFMDEVLYKSLKEAEQNQPLFDYVVAQLDKLDNSANVSSMPISFLLETAHHLGIEPLDNYSTQEPLFNLKEGRFQAVPSKFATVTNPNYTYFLDGASSTNIHNCLISAKSGVPSLHLTASQRSNTLNNLLEYYHVHLSDFRNFTSHQVLHDVLR